MDTSRVAEFEERYRQLDEWELADIYAKYSTLTDEARAALDGVIRDRNIDLAKMRQQEATEELHRAEVEHVRYERWKKRDAFLLKVFVAIGLPIAIVGALLRPERAYETFVSTLVQTAGLGLVAWVVLAIKRSRSKRKQ
jgi:hypothetical protein